MSGTCASCRWWGWPGTVSYDGSKTCALLSAWPGINTPDPLAGQYPPNIPAHVVPFAGADDGALVTEPTFGCNQWEAKP